MTDDFLEGVNFFYRLNRLAYDMASEKIGSRIYTDGDNTVVLPHGYDADEDPGGLLARLDDGGYCVFDSGDLDDCGGIAKLCRAVLNNERLGSIRVMDDPDAARAIAEGVSSVLAQSPRPGGPAGGIYDMAIEMVDCLDIGHDPDQRGFYCYFQVLDAPKARQKASGRLRP